MTSPSISEKPDNLEVSNIPNDTISDLHFSPTADLLAASSWDSSVRIWEVMPNGSTSPKAMYNHEGPALCCRWNKDGTKLVSGGADKAARLFNTATGQPQQVAQHDAPIRSLRFFEANNQEILATGSWDKTVKYWDLQNSTPIAALALPERVFAMDIQYPYMVVATADRGIHIVNLSNPGQIYKTVQSPLKFQTRTITLLPPPPNASFGMGWAIGSIEGRVGIQYIEQKDEGSNFSFKAHRADNNVYPVNCITPHPQFLTVCTAGSDGTFVVWDIVARQKVKGFTNVGGPITAIAWNKTGNIIAYAVGYDWGKGYTGANGTVPNKIYLSSVKEEHCKAKVVNTFGKKR